jgi:hypothetical protein
MVLVVLGPQIVNENRMAGLHRARSMLSCSAVFDFSSAAAP